MNEVYVDEAANIQSELLNSIKDAISHPEFHLMYLETQAHHISARIQANQRLLIRDRQASEFSHSHLLNQLVSAKREVRMIKKGRYV